MKGTLSNAAIILLTIHSFGPIARGDSYDSRVGQRHAAFTLPATDDGRPVSLAEFRGKKVLLIQFASW